jgi:hypothetical protein
MRGKPNQPKDLISLKELKWCRLVAGGTPKYRAVREVWENMKATSSCYNFAKNLWKREELRAEVERLRAQDLAAMDFDRQSALRFLVDVIRTPAGCVDEYDAVAQEVTRETRRSGRGDDAEEYEVTKIKMPGKIDAIREFSRITGLYAPTKLEHSGVVESIEFSFDDAEVCD